VAASVSPRGEARILWEHANGNPAAFEGLICRRLADEPIAYITGHKEFWSLDFGVGPGVLVPRPETETLVEQALGELPDRNQNHRLLDLGTGSGCLLIALLKELPNSSGVGLDASEIALDWARRNIVRHGLESRCALLGGDWTAVTGSFDIIVSNPPYVRSGDLASLSPDVRDYEPQAALDGGPDGLAAYRALAPVLKRHLAPNGQALLEIGAGQSHLVVRVLKAAGLGAEKIAADLAGIPRCVMARQA
jgi:release factor glutamine methyltransferase